MSNQDLQQRFQSLSNEIEGLNLQKAKAEANMENLTVEKDKVENQILELANAKTIEEAKQKLEKLQQKLESLEAEAEAVLNG